jgi:hypothetical protein
MLRVAIGPQLPLASWNWVGFDLARELSRYFKVDVFEKRSPQCDVLIAVKHLVPEMVKSAKVIYLPIDVFSSPSEVERAAGLLGECAAVGCHAAPLMEVIRPKARRVFLIEHHAKFSLRLMPEFKERGFVLWIGAFEHLPYLLTWHARTPLPYPLVLLTNVNDERSRKQGFSLAHKLEVPMDLSEHHLNGHRLVPWCEQAQLKLMQEAKAAIDIKGGCWLGGDQWHQQMKPPTKAQQFVLSGIAVALNRDSHSFDYFQRRGLTLASPDERDRWFSRDYWMETQEFAQRRREEFSLKTIGEQMCRIIEEIYGQQGRGACLQS